MIHHAETSRADRALPAQRCNGIHRRAAERTDTRWKVPGMFEIHKRWVCASLPVCEAVICNYMIIFNII